MRTLTMLTKVKIVEEDKTGNINIHDKDIDLSWISSCAKTSFINLFLNITKVTSTMKAKQTSCFRQFVRSLSLKQKILFQELKSLKACLWLYSKV